MDAMRRCCAYVNKIQTKVNIAPVNITSWTLLLPFTLFATAAVQRANIVRYKIVRYTVSRAILLTVKICDGWGDEDAQCC